MRGFILDGDVEYGSFAFSLFRFSGVRFSLFFAFRRNEIRTYSKNGDWRLIRNKV